MQDNEKMTSKQTLKLFKRTFSYIDKNINHVILRHIIGDSLSMAIGFVGIFLSGLIIDGIVDGKSMQELILYAVICVGVETALILLSKLIGKCHRNEDDGAFDQKMTLPLSEKIMNMDYTRVEDSATHIAYREALTGSTDQNLGAHLFTNNVIDGSMALASIIIGLVLLIPSLMAEPTQTEGLVGFIQSWWGTAVIAAIIIAGAVFNGMYINKKAYKFYDSAYSNGGIHTNRRIYDYYDNYILHNYRNGKDIRIYRQKDLLLNEVDRCGNAIAENYNSFFKGLTPYNTIMACVDLIPQLAFYAFLIVRSATGMCSAGEVISTALYFIQIQQALVTFTRAFPAINSSFVYMKQIFDFLDIPDEKYKGTIPTEKRSDNEYEFEFKHVYFKYPGSEQYVLKDINLKWHIGEKMALVGRNGSGKSTLVKLLCRLYDATEGEITLNGIDIRKYKYEEYMDLFAVVFQDSKLFSFSMGENVAANTEYLKNDVTDCIKRAGLSERLDKMEKSIDTCIYKDFDEKGVEISGGEAQKLCLARAIYKCAPFIILDEPTAALDPISEHDIYTKFNSIVGTKTAVYISHRLSSCRFCDDITVLDDGKIVERGSHEALLAKNGTFAKLWAAQAEYYKDTAAELYA